MGAVAGTDVNDAVVYSPYDSKCTRLSSVHLRSKTPS